MFFSYLNTFKLFSKSFSNIDQVQIRNSSFFTRLASSDLWRSVTSVSKVGRKRGRGKGLRKKVDLNRGQIIGFGEKKILWPGLNKSLFTANILQINTSKVEDNTDYKDKIISLRRELSKKKILKVTALERGFYGSSFKGRSIGIPNEYNLENFDCKVIDFRTKIVMTGNTGRTRRVNVLAVCGNNIGIVGFGTGESSDFTKAIIKARESALNRLRLVSVCNGTIVHDFVSSYGSVTIAVFKMPPGFGVVANYTIKTICNVVGITDIYVKTIKNSNKKLSVTYAFILGLSKQKTYQDFANEKKLNIVEFKAENDFILPKIIAKPTDGITRKKEEISPEEIMDFRQYIFEGKVYEPKEIKEPNFTKYYGYVKFIQDHHYKRFRQQVRINLKKKYGEVQSFLTLREREERRQRKLNQSKNEN